MLIVFHQHRAHLFGQASAIAKDFEILEHDAGGEADKENRRLEKELAEIKKTCEQLQKDKEHLEWKVEALYDKLRSQGTIMAEQHYKLKSIFGDGENSAQT